MDKSLDAFRTISEVSDWLGVQSHVLRFWESRFAQIKPVKRAGGRRYYRPADMRLIGGIKKLLHDDGMTIKGVQKVLREQGVAHVSAMSRDLDDMAVGGAKTATGANVLSFQRHSLPPIPEATRVPMPETAKHAKSASPGKPLKSPTKQPVKEAATSVPKSNIVEEQPALSGFLTKKPVTLPIASAPAPRVRDVDLPEPPADDQSAARPGCLTLLTRIDRLPLDQAADVAGLVQHLRTVHTRMARIDDI
ncbi:MAG: MerR family transcriptional regulator [Rhodobacteraceae bacterium]|nr:MerR family transcriptional regulator [Paracoccaceae bacterium]